MAKNQLRIDPSRTTMLRRKFVTEMNKRFREIKRLIKQFLVTDDELGLKPRTPGLEGLQRTYAFATNPQKTKAFRDWLQIQIDAKVLTVDGFGKPWTNTYIDSAYRKGYVRAYADANPPAVAGTPDFFQGGQQQFIKDAFAQPETLSKLEMLFTRTFEDLKDVTGSMSAQMNRILTDGIAHGDGPEQISREMNNAIDKLTRTRARVIARTEIINAHSEGQLDSFERLGIDELNLQVEWLTAGDDRVCVACQEMAGQVFSVKEARGLIPLHPNCRCAWIPVTRRKRKAG